MCKFCPAVQFHRGWSPAINWAPRPVLWLSFYDQDDQDNQDDPDYQDGQDDQDDQVQKYKSTIVQKYNSTKVQKYKSTNYKGTKVQK